MKRLIKMKRLLLILLICNLAVVNGHAFTLPDTYLTAPSDTTRYGEDSDEAENDTINRNPKNLAQGVDAITMVLERRYKAYNEYFTKKWHDHLFIQAGIGFEQMVPPSEGYKFNTLGAVNLGVGKQFNKYNTVRLMFHGAWGYQQSKDRLFTKLGIRLDHNFSLTSYFSGYKPTRLLDISTLFGVGVQFSKLSYENILWEKEMAKQIAEWEALGDYEEAQLIRDNWPKNQHATSFEAHVGAQLKFFTGPQGYITVEPYVGIGGASTDLTEHRNWRKTDIFYGLNVNYIYYIHNNLSPRERLKYIRNRPVRDLLSTDSLLLSWQQPWFFEFSNGVNFLFDTELSDGKTIGPDISFGVGRWFSPVIGLRLTGAVRQMTWRQRDVLFLDDGVVQDRGYAENMHNIYGGVRLEAIFNPFGFSKNFSWSDKFGAYLVGGFEYGWVKKYQTQTLSTRSEGYTGGVHLWAKLSDGLQLFLEPRYIHYNYKVPYTNVTWNKLYSDNSASVSVGLTVSTRSRQFRSMDHDETRGGYPLRKIRVGIAGGFNFFQTTSNFDNSAGMGYNGKLVVEYHLDRLHSFRAIGEFVGMSRSGLSKFYDYNMDSEDPAKTVVTRQGMWDHDLKFALAGLGYQINLSNLLAGYHAKRRADLSLFLGPSLLIPIDDKAVLSSEERVMVGHLVEPVEQFKTGSISFGGHLGVKLRMPLSSRISVIAEPTIYFLGNTKVPCVNSFKGLNYMETINVGLQCEL